jgi:hypothetical protein
MNSWGFHALRDVTRNKTIEYGLLKRLMERHVNVVNGTWSQPRIQLLAV